MGRENPIVRASRGPRRLCASILGLLAGFYLSPAAGYSQEAAVRPERDLSQPLTVAVSDVFFPYMYRDHDGELKGFAFDLTDAIARTLNLKLNRVVVANNDMTAMFQRGEIDLAQFWAETESRRAYSDFSVPIARAETIAVVRKDDTRIRRLRDLDGKRVAVGVLGNVSWRYLVTEHPSATPVFTDSSEQFLRALSAGEIDAAVMSRLTAVCMLDRFGLSNLKVLDDQIPGEAYDVRYCYGVRKGDALLLARLNEGLAILHRNGELDRIYQKWFGRYEPRTFKPVEVASYVAVAFALACIAATWGFLRQRTLSRRIARQAAELAEQRSLLAALHEKHPLATLILEVPATGAPTLASANAEAVRLFALEGAPLPCPLERVPLSADMRAHVEAAIAHWRKTGQPHQWETQLPATQQLLEAALMPLGHDEAGNQRLCILSNDVTQRRLMDQEVALSRRLRALGELVGGIAHEFNNLLTPIIMTTSRAQQDAWLPRPVQSDYGIIEGAARRAADLTRRLLAFGRKAEATPRAVRLAEAVENCFALLQPTVDRRVQWIFRPVDLPPLLFNPTDLNQIVFNLVLNARDTLLEKLAQPPASDWMPRLIVSIEALPPEARAIGPATRGDRVLAGWQRLTVADNGLGIAPEIAERIFEPFFTTKEVGRGTGLGLATVWHLVTEAGGEVTMQSRPGWGSQFHVTLPQWVDTTSPAAPAPPPPPDAAAPALRVLVVDDEPLVAQAAQTGLERNQHRVTVCSDGAEAWARFAPALAHFDLLLVDMNMPRMNGLDFIRRVRTTPFKGAILVMSGRLTETERAALESLRVDGVLGKPFSVADLDQALLDATRRRPAAGVSSAPPSAIVPPPS